MPGKDGFVPPPGNATAAGIAARLTEVGRQLSGNQTTAAGTPEVRKALLAAQRVTWRVPPPAGLEAAWKTVQKLHAAVPSRAEGRGNDDGTDWKFPLAMAIAAVQAPLRAHFEAASKEAAVVRKAGYKQWIQKALANGMGGAARYAKPEQPADLSIVQISIGQGPPKPGDATTKPAAKQICWATD